MKLKKINELKFKENDIYLLAVHNNKVILNNNYKGLYILNFSLNILQEIITHNKILPTFIYKNYSSDLVALYCNEDNQFIIINILTQESKIIAIPKNTPNCFFEPNYYWNENLFILTTDKNKFYTISYVSQSIREVCRNTITAICSDFFNFWQITQNYQLLTVYPHTYSFIFQYNDFTVGFHDSNKKITYCTNPVNQKWHDIEYCNNTFMFISEEKIELLQGATTITLIPKPKFYFLRAKFLTTNTIITLSSDSGCNLHSLIEIFTIN